MARLSTSQKTSLTILVAALGYFVDVFDLQLFSMLRVSSLKDLGLSPAEITSVGTDIINWQMGGMLVGGILWGMLGDKRGRVYVLFGTIILYSLGNIANAFVTTIPAYEAARFFTGVGLAGEIGAGITLANELLSNKMRTYASSVIVSCGVMGPFAAGFMAEALDWRWAYIGGGVLGLLLLALRLSVNESGMFNKLGKQPQVARGRFSMFFTNRARLRRYLFCIISGVPVWFVVGALVVFAPEVGMALGIASPLKASTAIISCYAGLTVGSFILGHLSQIFQNRKKVTATFILGAALTSFVLLNAKGISPDSYYALLFLDGFFIGYWTLFLTITAEQFGTNLRATATTTASNFVRAALIPITMAITALKPDFGALSANMITGAVCFTVALLALWCLPETFGGDLDFTEK